MILVTGGAYQGKTGYVREKFGISSAADSSQCAFDDVAKAECISGYHKLVKRLINADIDPIVFTEKLCSENSDAIIIVDEIGSGIIPIEKEERLWREAVGRCGCILAQQSDTVVRMVCGIPHALKGDLP